MFIFVNLPARFVLLFIELILLALGQVPVVGGHVGLLLILDVLFAILQMSSLSGCELVVLHAIRDAILLVLLASVNLVDARMTGIDSSRTCTLGLSRGEADCHETARCQDE